MPELNASKLIRVQNHHVDDAWNITNEDHLIELLREKEFVLEEKSADGFIETWLNKKYKDNRIHTLFFFDEKRESNNAITYSTDHNIKCSPAGAAPAQWLMVESYQDLRPRFVPASVSIRTDSSKGLSNKFSLQI